MQHVELKETLQGGAGDRFSDGSQIGLLHNGTFYTFTGDPALSEAQRKAQVQKTYQALLGIQGQSHPMAGAEVVQRAGLADGTVEYKGINELSGSAQRSVNKFQSNWDNYTDKLESSSVEEHKIFEFNLNRFTSGSGSMKIQTYW